MQESPQSSTPPPQRPDGQSQPPQQLPQQALPRIIPVEELLGQEDEVCILCGTQLYRLRRTRQGKLILYK